MAEKLDVDWSMQIAIVAGSFCGNRKSWFAMAAHRAGITPRQAKALYYGECTNPDFDVGARVLSTAEKYRQEANKLATQFEAAAGALNAKDSAFYSNDILGLIEAARRIRGVARS